jgi:RND family efflux transporter MFP subunit
MSANYPLSRKLLILPPIIIGIVVVMWFAKGRQDPTEVEHSELSKAVRIIEARALDLIPSAEGYGPVSPARVWTAVSQVSGRIVWIHPQLRDGEILAKDTELLHIDPVDYELALAQVKAEFAELEVQESNAQATLKIEQRNLALTQQDLERKRKLARQGSSSQSDADTAERAMLSSRVAVQNLQNSLSLIPTQRSLLEAKIARSQRDLEHTIIRAPFTLRVANLQIEADQYVTQNKILFEGDSVDRVEIEAQVAMSSLRRLFLGHPQIKLEIDRLNEQLPEMVGLKPLVRLDLGNYTAEWQAEFVRFDDRVDPQTRTMGIVVAVAKPFEKVIPGYRPPLSKGMFVQVVLRGKSQATRLVIPRMAVRGGKVYLADEQNRLRIRNVKLLFSQGKYSVVKEGLEPGERVVVSDVIPAVEGMLLQPEIDENLNQALQSLGDKQ